MIPFTPGTDTNPNLVNINSYFGLVNCSLDPTVFSVQFLVGKPPLPAVIQLLQHGRQMLLLLAHRALQHGCLAEQHGEVSLPLLAFSYLEKS